jgi:cytochrome c oxidase subunit 2
MIGVTLAVVAAFVYPALRYRRRTRAASQHSEAPRVEAILAAVLLAIAAVLGGLSLSSEGRFAEPEAAATAAVQGVPATRDALRIDVTAARWRWRFDYRDERITIVGGEPGGVVQLVVPRGRPVRLRLTALDVVHSLYLVDQRFKRDAVPGEVNVAYLRFNRPGRSFGHCAEFCGTYHADMNVQVVVLEPEAFARWTARGGGKL